MSLTPKNWKSFQHYRDRAPSWIKLHRGLLDDFEFHRLPITSKALAPMLWLLAAEYDDGTITAGHEEIAFRLRMSLTDFERALAPLIERGFFVAGDVLADCKPDAIPEKEREAETEEETDSRSVAAAPGPLREPATFDEFWTAYPRRDGPNPRKPAEAKFNALVKSGVDPRMMIAEIRKFATTEAARGNLGTRFIPQAMTWLSQQRWADHAAVASPTATIDPELQIEQAVTLYARTQVWSRHAGPAPGQTGCRASAALLAQHGIAPDGRKLPGPAPHAVAQPP